MNDDVIIRPYRPEDLPPIVDIANRAWQPIYSGFRQLYGEELFKLLYPHSDTYKGSYLTAWLSQHPDWCVIAEHEGKVIGFATFEMNPSRPMAVLDNNALDPDCKLKGVGQKLYAVIFERMRQAGYKWVVVNTGNDEGHARARRAYERAGFSIRRESLQYYKKL